MITRWHFAFVLFFLLAINQSINQQVNALRSKVPIAIDLGSEYAKISSIKPSTTQSINQSPEITIVLDEFSKRKVPVSVAWDHDRRYFGSSAVMFVPKRPTQAFRFPMRMLGKTYHQPIHPSINQSFSHSIDQLINNHELLNDGQLFQLMFPYDIVPIHERNTVGFRHYVHHPNSQPINQSAGQSGSQSIDQLISQLTDESNYIVYSPEELMAMNLEYFVHLAEVDQAINQPVNQPLTESAGQSLISGAVLTVPSYFNQHERQALLDAAGLANLQVYQLINQNTAAMIQFALDRPTDEFVTPHIAMIVNMGASSFEVTIGNITAVANARTDKLHGHINILSHAYDRHLGGQYFEHVLTEHMADQFNDMLRKKRKSADDIRAHPRAYAKLALDCEKAKKVLSANKEAIVHSSGLLHDLDFKSMITRDQYVQLVSPLVHIIPVAIHDALAQANISASQLSSVTIVGGGTYTPTVQEAIQQSIDRSIGQSSNKSINLGRSLNADEAMATGAEFRALQLSQTYRTRSWQIYDITSQAVNVQLEDSKTSESESNDQSTNPTMEQWQKDFSLFKKGSQINKRKTVTFTHDHDFTALLTYQSINQSTELSNQNIVQYSVTGLSSIDFSTTQSTNATKPLVKLSFFLDQSGLVSLVKAEATFEQIKQPINQTTDESTNNSTDQSTTNSTNQSTKPIIRRIPLKVSIVQSTNPSTYRPMNTTEKRLARSRLGIHQSIDESHRSIDRLRNDVESLIYKTRADINDGIWDNVFNQPTNQPIDREVILTVLAETEDWLYEQADQSINQLTERLMNLKRVIDPLEARHRELTNPTTDQPINQSTNESVDQQQPSTGQSTNPTDRSTIHKEL